MKNKAIILQVISVSLAITLLFYMDFTKIILDISFFFMMFIYIYLSFLSLFGWKKPKRRYDIIPDKTRFLILIPCHNEEYVIRDTVLNLMDLEYDKDKYLIVPINDNSTDNTKAVLDEMGVFYVNTEDHDFNLNITGKQRALQIAMLVLGEDHIKENFDLITIFDADNRAQSNYLTEINSQWQDEGKPEAIQAYLDSRNHDNLLSSGYAASYWIMNNAFQLAKYRLNLPNSIGGTGYSVDAKWLIDNGGFNYVCLTEDLAMEMRIVRMKGRVLWNHFTKVYDEKPTSLKVSIVQRTRWAQGHWYVCFTNLFFLIPIISVFTTKKKKTLYNFFESFRWSYIDQILYTFTQGKSFQVILIIIYGLQLLIQSQISDQKAMTIMGDYFYLLIVPFSILTWVLFFYNFLIQPILATYLFGNKKIFTTGIVAINYFSLTYIWCMILGLFNWRKQDVWISTAHYNKVTTDSE